MTIWRMRFAYCIPKTTDTHSEYVVFIAFPQQQWLHERALMLRYTYNACLVLAYKRIAEVQYPADMWTDCLFKTAVGAAA